MNQPYENLICHTTKFTPGMNQALAVPTSWRGIMRQFKGKVRVFRGNNGPFWEVGVAVDDDDANDGGCLLDGWHTFVTDNQIVKGEILKVYYASCGTFYVRIFTKDSIERLAEPDQAPA